MRRILTLTLCCLALAEVAYAQRRNVVEFEGGGGYVFGSGTESPGPSLPTLDGAVVVWATPRWGVALRRVAGPGEDLYATPLEGSDRTFLGTGHLYYWTVTARHRRSLSRDFGLEVGFGVMLDEKSDSIVMFRNPPRRDSVPEVASGFSLEALVTHPLGRHFAVKAGTTYDFVVEVNHFQPVALAVVGF